MADPWDGIKDATLGAIKDGLKGFLESAEADEFAKQKSAEYAREWWGSVHAATEAERAEHLENLEHLKAHVRSEVDRLAIKVSVDAKNTFVRILETVGAMLLKVAPKLLGAI